jgi:hypothetical protein
MNYRGILISEQEKNRILNLHTSRKQKSSLIKEAQDHPQVFPVCVRWAGNHVDLPANDIVNGYAVHVPNGGGKGRDYYWSQETEQGRVMVEVDAITKEIRQVRSYNCVCLNGKCQAKSYADQDHNYKKEHECSDKTPCKQGGQTDGEKPGGANCKNKTPYNVVAELGLNFKEVQKKWIDSGCMGTTPCSYDEARTKGITNINLRNAICDGKWDPKTGKGKEGDGGGQDGGNTPIKEGDWMTKFPCLEHSWRVTNKIVKRDDFKTCGCFYDKSGPCVYFIDGTMWCENPTGNGTLYKIVCNQNQITRGEVIQDNIPKPKGPSGPNNPNIKIPDVKIPIGDIRECVVTILKNYQIEIKLPTSCLSSMMSILPGNQVQQCLMDIVNAVLQALLTKGDISNAQQIFVELFNCIFKSVKNLPDIKIPLPDPKNPGRKIEIPIKDLPGMQLPEGDKEEFLPPFIKPKEPIKPKD